jgi:hypothetical protein
MSPHISFKYVSLVETDSIVNDVPVAGLIVYTELDKGLACTYFRIANELGAINLPLLTTIPDHIVSINSNFEDCVTGVIQYLFYQRRLNFSSHHKYSQYLNNCIATKDTLIEKYGLVDRPLSSSNPLHPYERDLSDESIL